MRRNKNADVHIYGEGPNILEPQKQGMMRNGPTWAVAGTWRFRPDEQPRDSAMTEVAPKLPQTVRNGIVYVGEGISFERVRRITGYLVGTLDRFNNAKRAEEADRVKHG